MLIMYWHLKKISAASLMLNMPDVQILRYQSDEQNTKI